MFLQVASHSFSEPLILESGKSLPGFTLVYETYGKLNDARDNTILLFHGLTATAHAAGKGSDNENPVGWWDTAIGPGKAIDTDRWHVVCIAAPGGFGGSTGPASIDPETGKPYGLRFPVLTVGDMVVAMKRLLDVLAIHRVRCLIGGCLGGFLVQEWMARYPEMVHAAVVIGSTARTSAYNLALWEVARRAIFLDPNFNGGDYYGGEFPRAGIALGTMFGVLVWMSREVMEQKFGLTLAQGREKPQYTLEPEFAVQEFLRSIESRPMGHFDPNGFIYLTKAMDYFDLERACGSLENAFSGFKGRALLVSFDSDWRYPSSEIDRTRLALEENGAQVEHRCLHTSFGHGAFLYDFHNGLDKLIGDFLDGTD